MLLQHHTVTYPSFCSLLCVSLLYVLQGGLAQQQWRVSELLHRLLAYLEPKLTQVYKNVRERIGRYNINLVLVLLDYIRNLLICSL